MRDHPEKIRTIFISRCLTRDLLETDQITTSSQKFESGFLREYAKLSDLEIVSIERPFARAEALRCMDAVISGSGYLDLVWRMHAIKKSGVSAILVTGYDLRVTLVLLAFRFLGIRTFAFIYDSHRQSLNENGFIKGTIINLYFSMGFFLARFLDGWIVLNDEFINRRHIKTPYKKINIGVKPDAVPERQNTTIIQKKGDKGGLKVVLFSGTLNSDNGLHILIDAFRASPRGDVQLHIYGDGNLADCARQAAHEDSRISFFGRIENSALIERQREADYLVHLRDPGSIASEYSYPSKLIEYLSSDTPVLSNLFPGIGEVADYVIPIPDYSVAAVARALAGVLDGTGPVPARTSASAWLAATRGWDRIAAEVYDFVTGTGGAGRRGSPRPG